MLSLFFSIKYLKVYLFQKLCKKQKLIHYKESTTFLKNQNKNNPKIDKSEVRKC